MKEIDDLDLKAEIDEISKKIDSIVQNIEALDPQKNENDQPSDPQLEDQPVEQSQDQP